MRPDAPHVAQLDGLRGIAILGVCLSHYAGVEMAGSLGVHLFFVLSGFLITGILLRARAEAEARGVSPGTVLRPFYIRRALRIAPAYYATLALYWLADVGELRARIGWHLAYLSNVLFAWKNTWDGGGAHLWSLSVEEQFYLAWPALVLFCPRRWLPHAMSAAVLVAPAWRAIAYVIGLPDIPTYVLPMGALDSLGIGGCLALATDGRPVVGPAPRWLRWYLPVAAAVLLAMYAPAAILSTRVTDALGVAFYSVAAVGFAALTWAAARGLRGPVGALLGWAPLAGLGRISYGVYLVHLLIALPVGRLFGVLDLPFPEQIGAARFVLLTSASVAVAAVSWRWFEAPINAWKARFPYMSAPGRAAPDAERLTVRPRVLGS